ncbi:MAG: Asp-tRNA(Asn)/Glu-tRNA(Gln) amidotransferase subunit GatC [Candidatus Nealsonbacteria bacterium]
MISKEEVQHIAKLARLGLSREEVKEFQKELSSILDYIEILKELKVSEVEPTNQALKIENVTREDEEYLGEKDAKKLLDLAPDKKEGYLKVKSVL